MRMNELVAVQTEDLLPPDRDPAHVYLASLAPSGRRTMAGKLAMISREILGIHDPRLVPWHRLRYQHVAAIRTRLQEIYAPTTVNAALYAIRGVARAAFALELMDADAYERIRGVRPVRGERLPVGRRLTKGELAALMDTCANDGSAAGVRDGCILALLYACGLRRSELSALALDSHDPASGELRVLGKGNKERMLYVDNGCADALADWREIRGGEIGPLFCPIDKAGRLMVGRGISDQAVYCILKKRAKQAGVRDLKTHDCRRSFLTDLLQLNVDVATCAKLAGHSQLQTVATYDLRGEDSKRQAISLLHVPYRRRERVQRDSEITDDPQALGDRTGTPERSLDGPA